VIEADGTRVTWSYDNLYQLTRERRSGTHAYDITYTYDLARNRKTTLENSVRTTYVYDTVSQLKYLEDDTGRTTFAFDANGNQAMQRTPAGARTTNTWDYENRLTKIALPSGTHNSMVYDTDGRRVKKEDSRGVAKFVWDGANTLLTTDDLDVTQVAYTLQPNLYGILISQHCSQLTSLYHFDAVGSTVQLTDGIGSVTDDYIYNSFGSVIAHIGMASSEFSYGGKNGYYCDADSGHYYLRSRYYNPAAARFLSRDTLLLAVWNHYRYAENNPWMFSDPSGLQAECIGRCVSGLFTCATGRGSFRDVTLGPIPSDARADPEIDWITNLDSRLHGDWVPEPPRFRVPTKLSLGSDDPRKCCCCCDEVRVAQVVLKTEYRSLYPLLDFIPNAKHDCVDRGIPSQTDWVVPCLSAAGLELQDYPGTVSANLLNRVQTFRQEFETCVICYRGIEGVRSTVIAAGHHTGYRLYQMVIYGCFTWSHAFEFTGIPPIYRVTRTLAGETKHGVFVAREFPLRGGYDQVSVGPKSFVGSCPPSAQFQNAVKEYYLRRKTCQGIVF
jgi:RHS repeat-associated protein